MTRTVIAVLALLLFVSKGSAHETGIDWLSDDIAMLKRWVAQAPADALPVISTASLDRAVASADQARIEEEATALAFHLARMHLLGGASSKERTGWNIVDTDRDISLEPMLEQAVAHDTLDTFFALLRPSHQEYSVLRAAYARETDVLRRRTIGRNMERWRWMPRSLGDEYVLVNTARFKAYLWRKGAKAKTFRVIVGKKSTPTPVFDASIVGVVLNPWWNVPASIVRESVGALVRNNPSAARARGYVWSNGSYRQRPGPNNALGRMKLVMPNRFSVNMHDTPNRELFEEDIRAFSHGCIRTDDAIGYATTLLEGVKTRKEIDAILASGQTTTINLARSIPVYIAYFTAVADEQGGVHVIDDIYNRDGRINMAASPLESECSA